MLLRPGSAPADRARRTRDDRLLRVVRILGTVFGGLWALSIAAGALGATGVGAVVAAQGKLVFLAALVLMFAIRGVGSLQDRAAWWCFSAATVCYLAGVAMFEFHYRFLPVL